MDLKADEFIKTPDQKTHHKERLRKDRCVGMDVQRVILLLFLFVTLNAFTRQNFRLICQSCLFALEAPYLVSI